MNKTVYITPNICNYQKTALVFAPRFFRIQDSIIKGFEANGIGLYLFLDKPKNSVFLKSKLRLNPKMVAASMTKYLKKEVFRFFNNVKHPDYVVVFEGQAFLEKHVMLLKSYFSHSKTIIYCWDSIERFPYIEKNLKHFDKTITFSYDNYSKYNFDDFVPLFIPSEFNDLSIEQANSFAFDLCFIGTGHPPKISFLLNVEKFAETNNLSFYESIFLPTKLLFFYYKMTSKSFHTKKLSNFVFVGKNALEIQNLYSKAKAVVDAGNPNESGVSLRIFECLAMQKKVILANKSIKNYSFYNPQRFLVFPDESNRFIDFLNSPYPKLSTDELQSLSPEQWIRNIVL